jgi:hypothetical protein
VKSEITFLWLEMGTGSGTIVLLARLVKVGKIQLVINGTEKK